MKRQRTPTIRDVASVAKVTTNEVMRVVLGHESPSIPLDRLNNIYRAMEKLNFVYIAPNIDPNSQIIAVFYPGVKTHGYVDIVLSGIQNEAQRHEFNLILNRHNVDLRQNINAVTEFGNLLLGAIFLLPDLQFEAELVEICQIQKIPFVMIDNVSNHLANTIPTIEANNEAAIIKTVQHLRSLGHEQIGFITGLISRKASQERLNGFHKAMNQAGLPVIPHWVAQGDWMEESGYIAARQILRQSPYPTAIIASSDLMAMGAMRYLQDMGIRIPEDISVTGFDDIPSAVTTNPPLTTIQQPMTEIGTLAVQLLRQITQSTDPHEKEMPLQVRVETQLIVRQSTAVKNLIKPILLQK